MRAPALLLLAACAGPADRDSGRDRSFSYPLDGVLRVQHLQAKGTHNSYHQAPDHDVIAEWNYTHAPLGEQAACQGVRQFELDIHRQDDGSFRVFHVPALDEGSSCETLVDCLGALRAWSDDNPAHHPLFVMIEPKDLVRADEAEGYLAALEASIAAAWPDRLLTPDLVQGAHATLADAIGADGWPTLGEVRGHLLLWLLDSGDLRAACTAGGQSLAGRLMFVKSDPGEPVEAVVMRDEPSEEIPEIVAQNLLVRTRADAGGVTLEEEAAARRDAALASGATLVSTDFPAPVEGQAYWLQIPGGAPSRCNPVTAPPECTSEAIEDPQFMDHTGCGG